MKARDHATCPAKQPVPTLQEATAICQWTQTAAGTHLKMRHESILCSVWPYSVLALMSQRSAAELLSCHAWNSSSPKSTQKTQSHIVLHAKGALVKVLVINSALADTASQ